MTNQISQQTGWPSRISALRKAYGRRGKPCSRKFLALKFPCSEDTILNWETGKTYPTFAAHIKKIEELEQKMAVEK